MPNLLSRIVKRIFPSQSLDCVHEKRDASAWLTKNIPAGKWFPPVSPDHAITDERFAATEELGKQPLWEGYAELKRYERTDMQRTAKEVSTFGPLGDAFAWIVSQTKPELIVEIGTAFGFSGMNFLSGIKQAETGHLLTFEPNEIWAKQALKNLAAMDSRFTLINGTFENNAEHYLRDGKKVDMALIDAIHTSEFVLNEYDLITKHTSSGALLFIDDIDFSDDMRSCWHMLVQKPEVKAAVSFGRLGILELQ